MFLVLTTSVFLKREVLFIRAFLDKLIPGNINPPEKILSLITSNVVAVPKSITMLLLILLLIIAIELAILSAPISFKL